jgi:hypothetical protein
MDKRKEYIAELVKKGYTKQQASLIATKQQGGVQTAGNTNGYSNNQKQIARILRNVQTSEVKEGSLQPGYYTKVEYQDGSSDYLKPENEDMFRRMPNYIEFMQKSTQRQEPIMDANPIARAQQGRMGYPFTPLNPWEINQPTQNQVVAPTQPAPTQGYNPNIDPFVTPIQNPNWNTPINNKKQAPSYDPNYNPIGGRPFDVGALNLMPEYVPPTQPTQQPAQKTVPYQQAPNPWQLPQQPDDVFTRPTVQNVNRGIADVNSPLYYNNQEPVGGLTKKYVTPYIPQTTVPQPTTTTQRKDAGSPIQPIKVEERDFMKEMQQNAEVLTESIPTGEQPQNKYSPNRVNLISPDGGLSLDYALNYAGRGFGSKNAMQAGIGTGLSLLKGARNFLTGFSEGKENLRVADEMQDYQFDRPRNFVYRQSGGKIKNSDVIAQNALTDEGQGNINMEMGEFVLRREGQVQPVVGEPHVKNGKIADGVNATLNDGDKVISDYVKLKPIDVKELKERYDLSVKKGITFAQAQKKLDQKLGIKKLEEEKATVLEKLEKASKIKDEASRELSTNALTKSMATINEKLGTLGEIRAEGADFIFTLQEAHPKKGSSGELFDKNGKLVTQRMEENTYQQGGDFYITQLAKKHNIPIERAMELVNMQMGGEQPQEGGQEQQIMQMVAEALQNGASPEEILQQLVDSGVPQEQAVMIVEGVMQQMQAPQEQQIPMAQQGLEKMTDEDRAKRFDDAYKSYVGLGYEGKKDIGEIQKWLTEKYPEDVVNYYIKSGQPANAKHIDIIKEKYKDIFKTTGIDPNKPSASYTSEEKKKLTNALGENATKEFWLEGFKDNLYDWRLPLIGNNIRAIDTNTPLQVTPGKTLDGNSQNPAEVSVEKSNGAPTNNEGGNGVRNIMTNFEPYIPLFGAIQPIAKQNVAFQRQEPVKATVEPMLAEQERMRMTDVERTEQLGLTPQQQEALMASGLATSQMSANDAISKTEQWNAQNQFATDQYNLGIGAKEQIMNNQFDSDYQDKMMQTLATLEDTTRGIYRDQYLQGVQNRRDVANMNLINARSDQFAITPYGIEYLNNKGIPVQDNSFMNKKLEDMTPAEREEYKRRQNFAEAQKRAMQ